MQIYDLFKKVTELYSASMSIYHSKDFDNPTEVGCDALICGYIQKGAMYLVKRYDPLDNVTADFVGMTKDYCLVFGYKIHTDSPF